MENDEKKPVSPRKKRKITPERLKNIALYYLERFDSSADNLRRVLNRRVFDHAREIRILTGGRRRPGSKTSLPVLSAWATLTTPDMRKPKFPLTSRPANRNAGSVRK